MTSSFFGFMSRKSSDSSPTSKQGFGSGKKKKRHRPGFITKVADPVNESPQPVMNSVLSVGQDGVQSTQLLSEKQQKSRKRKLKVVGARNRANSLTQNTMNKTGLKPIVTQEQCTGTAHDEKTNVSHRNATDLNLNDDNGITNTKLQKYKKIMQATSVDLKELRRLAWGGVPFKYRSEVWQILVGYLPCNKSRRDQVKQQRRKDYMEFVNKYYNDKAMDKTDHELNILRQIHIDVPRTNPLVPLFQFEKTQQALERILYIWSIRHPASGYVQGLNDLVTPFYTVFLHEQIGYGNACECNPNQLTDELFYSVEADAFWCFSYFLDFIQDHYTFNQPGIRRMIDKLEDVMSKIDKKLYQHMKDQGLLFLQFSFRWMNCVLMRELSLKLIIRMFDTLLSEGKDFEDLHIYICAAFLKTWSEQLCKMDFTEMVLFIQHLPVEKWTYNEMGMLLSQSFILKSMGY